MQICRIGRGLVHRILVVNILLCYVSLPLRGAAVGRAPILLSNDWVCTGFSSLCNWSVFPATRIDCVLFSTPNKKRMTEVAMHHSYAFLNSREGQQCGGYGNKYTQKTFEVLVVRESCLCTAYSGHFQCHFQISFRSSNVKRAGLFSLKCGKGDLQVLICRFSKGFGKCQWGLDCLYFISKDLTTHRHQENTPVIKWFGSLLKSLQGSTSIKWLFNQCIFLICATPTHFARMLSGRVHDSMCLPYVLPSRCYASRTIQKTQEPKTSLCLCPLSV